MCRETDQHGSGRGRRKRTQTTSTSPAAYFTKNTVAEHGARLGTDVQVVARNTGEGFVVQAKRWIVEQSLGTLMMDRRLTRDYEHAPASSACRVHWSAISTITRRLTGQAAPSWRGA